MLKVKFWNKNLHNPKVTQLLTASDVDCLSKNFIIEGCKMEHEHKRLNGQERYSRRV